ncbi:hypothetical protein [Methanosphaerula palustris]|uniref:hypothetical protein n=1 Tax=Methanosphaerula palustris TaxID=475088 RepID=UPI001F1CF95B|nr:hypothetical protein [Methanosphaerula palustris]
MAKAITFMASDDAPFITGTQSAGRRRLHCSLGDLRIRTVGQAAADDHSRPRLIFTARSQEGCNGRTDNLTPRTTATTRTG